MPKVRILRAQNIFSTDPKRQGKLDTIVTYEEDTGGADFVIVQAEKPTEEEIRKAIRAHVEEQGRVTGRELEI